MDNDFEIQFFRELIKEMTGRKYQVRCRRYEYEPILYYIDNWIFKFGLHDNIISLEIIGKNLVYDKDRGRILFLLNMYKGDVVEYLQKLYKSLIFGNIDVFCYEYNAINILTWKERL